MRDEKSCHTLVMLSRAVFLGEYVILQMKNEKKSEIHVINSSGHASNDQKNF